MLGETATGGNGESHHIIIFRTAVDWTLAMTLSIVGPLL
jgi:hypothetical protein